MEQSMQQQPVPTTPTMATTPRRREGLMLCPVPQRPFQTPVPMLTPMGSASPNSVWSDADEATEASHELISLLGGADGNAFRRWDKVPFFLDGGRPGSTASTSAGPTPSPDSRGSPLRWSTPEPMASDQSDTAGSAQLFQDPHMAAANESRNTGTSQSRKVFVGGVPQEMTQEDLRSMFSRFGEVKKAWLQKLRPDPSAAANPMQNHRGFGFVVFQDDYGIEKLLGEDFSRFLPLSDGRKMEVKRALSSSSMAHGASTRTKPTTSTPKPSAVQDSAALMDSDWPARHAQHERAGFFAERSVSWQAPPPFPAVGVVPASWTTGGHGFVPTSFPNYAPAMTTAASAAAAAAAAAAQAAPAAQGVVPSAAAAGQAAPYPCIGSIAQMLGHDKDNLARALLEAMPDHYDD